MIVYEAGADSARLVGTGADDLLDGAAGRDRIHGGAGADRIAGLGADDTLYGDAGDDLLTGGDDSDSLFGGAGNDRLEGGEGADSLEGGPGDDIVYGGGGNDSFYEGGISGALLGNDSLFGGEGNDYFSVVGVASTVEVRIDGGTGDDYVSLHLAKGNAAFADGGEGEDFFYLSALEGQAQLTLGAGHDTVMFWGAASADGLVTITDFAVGAVGDSLNFEFLLLKSASWTGTNPFASGHLSLRQVGSDTVIASSAAANGVWIDLAVLKNVNAATLVSQNLGYAPGGGAEAGLTLTGTAGDDNLNGGNGNDVIDTGGATLRNQVFAGGGHDTITGGADRDVLYGESGDDLLRGELGNDHLNGGIGNDVLYGGAGNDTLRDEAGGTDTAYGEGGDDTISISRSATAAPGGSSSIHGGDGNDTLRVSMLNGGTAFVHGGSGADIVQVDGLTGAAHLTLGGGRDIVDLSLLSKPSTNNAVIEITDFAAGSGGDRLELATFLSRNGGGGANGANPFETGHLRLVQVEGDVVLQFDRNGGGDLFVPLLTLKNVELSALTAFNLGGFGTAGAAYDSLGSEGDDLLLGEEAGDRIEGLGGIDRIFGYGGNDTVEGGAGDDLIDGGAGDDLLRGGDGNDRMIGGAGSDTVEGGAGNDTISEGSNASGSDTVDGGDGDDSITVRRQTGSTDALLVRGGAGDDSLTVSNTGSGLTVIDAGEGADSVVLTSSATAVVTLGGGRDLLLVHRFFAPGPGTVPSASVLDFQAGPAGDAIDLSALYAVTSLNLDPATSPFAAGIVKAMQSGSDVHIQLDHDGAGWAYGLADWIILKNVDLWSLTDENFGGLQGPIIHGGTGADLLQGGTGVDMLNGGDGDDTLRIGYGNGDEARGGAGDDTIVVSGGDSYISHKVSGGEGSDTLLLRATSPYDTYITLGTTHYSGSLVDVVGVEKIGLVSGFSSSQGSALNAAARYAVQIQDSVGLAGTTLVIDSSGLAAGELAQVDATRERDAFVQLTGGAGWDNFRAGSAGSLLEGHGSADSLYGGAGDDVIRGGAGDDYIEDSSGNGSGTDLLDGGEGGDAMRLTRSSTASWTSATVLGGEGDDGIFVRLLGAGTNGTATVDAGNGSDTVQIAGVAGSLSVTLGAGSDTLLFSTLSGVAGVANPLVVTDFKPAEGDWMVWGGAAYTWLSSLGATGYANPFLSGHARLVQDGADALLEIVGPGGAFVTVARFQNIETGAFTGESLGNYALSAIEGTPGADVLAGSKLSDHVIGHDGNDLLRLEQGGIDLVRGGGGDDVLYFGATFTINDDVQGGEGNDVLVLQGNLTTDLSATGLQAETIQLLSGSDTRYGAPGTALHNYSLRALDQYVGLGQTLSISAEGLLAGEKLGFDGSREKEGSFLIRSGAGDDALRGGAGADEFHGGAGADALTGEGGDDRLHGGDGTDTFTGGSGNDQLFGEGGDDILDEKGTGSDAVDGGAGADKITVTRLAGSYDTLTVRGGADGDTITVDAKSASVTVDAGSGADTVAFTSGANFKATLGEGSDLLDLTWYRRGTNAAPEILDFQAGAGGDRIEMSLFLTMTLSYQAYGKNPFATGYMRLFQSGSDVLLQVNTWGGGGTWSAYETVLIFRNANKLDFAAENLDGHAPMHLTGTDAAETFTGTAGDDVVNGGGGNDHFIFSQGGTDRLDAGAGDDTVFLHHYLHYAAQQGSALDFSRFHGGAGSDTLILQGPYNLDLGATTAWRNEVTGFETVKLLSAFDTTYVASSYHYLETQLTIRDTVVAAGATLKVDATGFRADEALFANASHELDGRMEMFGGAGNDRLHGSAAGADMLSGGAGNDSLTAGTGNSTLLGGAGTDTLWGGTGADRLDGGSGDDSMFGGAGDDVFEVDSLKDGVLEHANGGTDEVRTAVGSRSDFTQMYQLPSGVEKLTGTSATGQGVYGNSGDNIISMGAGADLVVLEKGGNDAVFGGGGDDFLYFGAAFTNGDSADGGAGYDGVGLLGVYWMSFDADDLVGIEKLSVYSSGVAASPNSYSLVTHDANVAAGQQMMVVGLSLTASEVLAFNGSAELDGSFNVRAGRANDSLTGGAKADTLYGNLGADRLAGGAGKDVFEYLSAAESTAAARDSILDFTRGDKINLINIDADGNAANGDSRFNWLGTGAFTGQAGQLRVSQDPANANAWLIEGDVNGDKIADLVIHVTGQAGFIPERGDFWL